MAWLCLLPVHHAGAQQLPGAADAARVQERLPELEAPPVSAPVTPPRIVPTVNAPQGSENIAFVLRDVRIEGATAFAPSELEDIYRAAIGKEIRLSELWMFAGAITERYQQKGYFLSRAYVPAQEIGDGAVVIKVVEGYIHEVTLDEKARANAMVVAWTERIKTIRPLPIDEMESLLLRLNDLAGQDYRGVLEKVEAGNAPEGAARLNVVTTKEPTKAQIAFDNFGSRFLGPYEATALVDLPLIENQRTSVAFLASTPMEELKYGSITHTLPLSYHWSLDMNLSRTDTHPGSSLKSQEIDSVSTGAGFGFTYQWLRQRRENLTTRIGFDLRNTQSTLFKFFDLTRDHVRAVQGNINYQVAEEGGGYNYGLLTVTQGIDGLGASEAGDANLSRAEARPDFTKIEWTYTRLQPLFPDISAVVSTSGQLASGPLYSSEEFGYGGQSFGRAYDSSELTGDHGIAASAELRYTGLPVWSGVKLSPYGFYDIGRVWNDDAGQEKQATGSSAGLGIRAATELGITANLGIAVPLTREIAKPIYGNGKSPRYMLQLSYDF